MLDILTSVVVMMFFTITVWWILYALDAVHDSKHSGNGKYGWARYKKFQEVFNENIDKVKIGDGYISNKGFGCDTWINTIEIKFDGTHMVLYPVSYFRFVIWFLGYTKNKTKLEKIKW